MDWARWHEVAAAIYYTGVGAVLLGTALRFIYKFIKSHDDAQSFVEEIRDEHLPNIYAALRLIAKDRGIDLPFEEYTKPKTPRQHKDRWTKFV